MGVDWGDGESITVTEYYDVREDGVYVSTTLEPEWRKTSITILPPPNRMDILGGSRYFSYYNERFGRPEMQERHDPPLMPNQYVKC